MSDFNVRLTAGGIAFIPASNKAWQWLHRSGKAKDLTGANPGLIRDRASAHVLAEALFRNGLSWTDEEARQGRKPVMPTPAELLDRQMQADNAAAATEARQAKSLATGWNAAAAKIGIVGAICAAVAPPLLLLSYCSEHNRIAEAEQQKKDAAQAVADAQEKAENHRKGFDCLTPIDGSDPELVRIVKGYLRDPDSFEHIETRITPADIKGNHQVTMTYRSRNGFGGMTGGYATGLAFGDPCVTFLRRLK